MAVSSFARQCRRAAAIVALAAALFAASGPRAAAGQPRITRAQRGILIGVVRFDGGPGLLQNVGGEVSLFRPDGHLVARERVTAGHEFRFRARPGRYLLNAGRQLDYKRPLGCSPSSARVRGGRTTYVVAWTGCGIP
ncbi:MAG TPA: hypothetical protein VG275_12655 [Solirubrobacteraceae bacterium]|jgi:hypothetical protein|nr:hypothetical protein [Solirubrobacteraceae bacterium]